MERKSVAEVTDDLRVARRHLMAEKGRRFATFLPGYRLLGVDPGYLFTPAYGTGPSISLPEFVVDHLLEQLT